MVNPIRSCETSNLQNVGEKDKRFPCKRLINIDPGQTSKLKSTNNIAEKLYWVSAKVSYKMAALCSSYLPMFPNTTPNNNF